MSKRVGQILKDTREEKRLTVRDIVKETNIPLKYVLALENEDYGQFPAETYTVGFLKTYADFLKLDTGNIINLFRGEQLEDANIPLQELTKPTMKMMAVEVRRNKAILPLILVLIVGIGVFAFSQFYEPEQENSNPSGAGENENRYLQGVPSDISFINQSVHDSERVPFTLTPEQGFTFSVNNQLCKIFIKGVRKNEDNENIAIIGFNLFPDKKVYTFETKVNENSVLSSKNPELSNLRREIKILTQAITEKSAKILVSLGEAKPVTEQGLNNNPVGDVPIHVTLFFSKSTFAEFLVDGQGGERGMIPAGETKQLEAMSRLEIKVGDGGAVDIVQNGKPKVKMGKPNRHVKKIFVKTQNRFDNTQFEIKELGE